MAVNLYLARGGPSRAGASVATPVASAAAPLSHPEEHAGVQLADAGASGAPAVEADAGPPAEDDEPPRDNDAPVPDKPGKHTVAWAGARACSTAHIDGLSRQIVAEARCIDANAFARVPGRRNLESPGNVFLYLDAPARDHLLRVLDAHPDRVMKVHSALRTVAQQYLLSRWATEKRCGIQLATRPGESNHETGLALDISEHAAWRSALESEGFRWLGTIDRVHFDFVGPGATHHDGLDVLAFQRLWNRNHPDDTLSETGRYNRSTEQRLKKSPAAGFPIGARCGRGQDARHARAAARRGGARAEGEARRSPLPRARPAIPFSFATSDSASSGVSRSTSTARSVSITGPAAVARPRPSAPNRSSCAVARLRARRAGSRGRPPGSAAPGLERRRGSPSRARATPSPHAGEARDRDAVAAARRAGHEAVQEHHVVAVLARGDGVVRDARRLLRELGELVVVRREERAAADDVVQVLGDRPGDGEAVVGARAAADLVEDDQRAPRGVAQDGGGLAHLDHEGALAARQVVARADAREDAVDDADARALRRHVAAHLREDDDERHLAHERRLARHVRAR